jgi:hypothetical protein
MEELIMINLNKTTNIKVETSKEKEDTELVTHELQYIRL